MSAVKVATITLERSLELDDDLQDMLDLFLETEVPMAPADLDSEECEPMCHAIVACGEMYLEMNSAGWACTPQTAAVALDLALAIRKMCLTAKIDDLAIVVFGLLQRIVRAVVRLVPMWAIAKPAQIDEVLAEHAGLIEMAADMFDRDNLSDPSDSVRVALDVPKPKSPIEMLLISITALGQLAPEILLEVPSLHGVHLPMAQAWSSTRIASLITFKGILNALAPVYSLEPMSSPAVEILQRSASRFLKSVLIIDDKTFRMVDAGTRAAINRWRLFAEATLAHGRLVPDLIRLMALKSTVRPEGVERIVKFVLHQADRTVIQRLVSKHKLIETWCGAAEQWVHEVDDDDMFISVDPLCSMATMISSAVRVPFIPIAIPAARMLVINSTIAKLRTIKTTTASGLSNRNLCLAAWSSAALRFAVAQSEPYELVCAYSICSHIATPEEPHQRCSGCAAVAYCPDKTHQKLHWRAGHKDRCKEMATAAWKEAAVLGSIAI